ncbi:MAG: hypothetical protein HUJ96_11185 [Marinilabiliaceae bacterium]|nr:hypothetical protein [Marinilabiliaceae bacterium]
MLKRYEKPYIQYVKVDYSVLTVGESQTHQPDPDEEDPFGSMGARSANRSTIYNNSSISGGTSFVGDRPKY